MNIVGIDCENFVDEIMVIEVVCMFVDYYLGYDWYVLVRGGVMYVKVQNIYLQWGMCLYYMQFKDDVIECKCSIICVVGEFLECVYLKCGVVSGEWVKVVEGILVKEMVKVWL